MSKVLRTAKCLLATPVLFVSVSFFLQWAKTEQDLGFDLGNVLWVDLPLQGLIDLGVDAGKAEEFVSESRKTDHATAIVGEVDLGLSFRTVEVGAGEDEGFEFLGGAFDLRFFGFLVVINAGDEIGNESLGLFTVFPGNDERDPDGAALWREVNEAGLLLLSDHFTDGGVAGFRSDEQKSGVNVARLSFSSDQRFVFLGVFCAGDEFQWPFVEADHGGHVDRVLLHINGHTRQFELV